MDKQVIYKNVLDNAIASVEMEGYAVSEEQKESCLNFLCGRVDKATFIKTLLEGSKL